jgi:Ca-activated chloride channel family protein
MVTDTDRITQGTLRTSTGRPLPLDRTDVKARVAGPVADVELRQVFRNDTGEPIEAVYLFPMPHEASVHRMSFRIGSRVVEATVKEKEEAKRAYEAARAEGRSATLLEQDRPNLFTLSVANIPPGETIEVTLGYQEKLAYDDGEWRFVFPMVAAERSHAGVPTTGTSGGAAARTDQVQDAPRIRPPRAGSAERPFDVSMEVEIHAGRSIEAPRSPSHRVVVEPIPGDPFAFRARLHEGDSIPNRDFVLAYRAGREGVRASTYFERRADAMGTFLLVVSPPATMPDDVAAAQLGGSAGEAAPLVCGNCGGALRDPGAVRDVPGIGKAFRCAYCGTMLAASPDRKGATVGLPRDVVFLVDRSCSMRGGSLPQARRAVRVILDALGPDDAVQLFAFDHERVAVDGAGDAFLPLSRESKKQVDAFLAGLSARGGTELEEAIERAAKLPVRAGRARLLVLVTDAALGNEGRLLRRVPEILGKSTRLYVLGVGPAVNRYLVERLARAAGGASDVLLPTEDVETVVPRFARRVRQAGPVLTGLKLAWDDAIPADVYPNPIPDLFGGQTVQLLGRFAGSGPSRLVLTGATATGQPFRQEVDVTLPEASSQIPGLERLWARLRIDARLERLAREPGEAAEVRLEVLGLALKHKLLSPYTALVAEDSERRVEGPARRVEVPVAEPMDEEEEEEAEEAPLARGAVTGAPRPAERAKSMDALESFADELESPGAPAAMSLSEDFDEDIGGAGPPPPSFGAPEAPRGGFGPPPALEALAMSRPAAAAPQARERSLEAPSAAVVGAPRGKGVFARLRRLFGRDEPEETEVPEPVFAPPPPPAPPPTPPPADLKAPAPEAKPPAPSEPPAPPPTMPAKVTAAGSDAYSAEMLAYAAEKGAGSLDLVFLVDETGSMGAYIEEVKRRLLEIIEALRAAPLCRSLRLGLVSYRDHPPADHTFASRVVPLTDDIPTIRKGVERMHAQGGGDGPESVTDGLYDLVRLDWRPRAARVVVWVGDAPPHGVEPTGDTFPQGCPCGHHWYAQAESCREMGIAIHAVGCMPALARYVGAVEVFRTVARTTRGLYLPLSRAPLLIPLITGVAETELDKQRIEELIAEALARYEAELAPAEDQERVRFLTDVLQQEGVQPRGIAYDPEKPGPGPLRFRPITAADVEEGIDRLRRVGRTAL